MKKVYKISSSYQKTKSNSKNIFRPGRKAKRDIEIFKNDNFIEEFSIESKNENKKTLRTTGVEIKPKGLKVDNDTIYILKFQFSWKLRIREMVAKSNDNNSVVIGFNPSGGHKMGFKKSILQVQRLLNKGVQPQNIVLDGYCFTGAIATLTAKYFYDKGIILNLFVDRAFNNTTNFFTQNLLESADFKDAIRENKTISNKLKRWCVNKIFSPIEKKITQKCNFNLEIGENFKALYKKNPDRITYTVFRPARSVNGAIEERDQVVAYNNSIHSALREERRLIKKPVKEAILAVQGLDSQIYKYENNLKQLSTELKDILTKNCEKYITTTQPSDLSVLNYNLFQIALEKAEYIQSEVEIKDILDVLKRINFNINKNNKFERLYIDENIRGHNVPRRNLYNWTYNNTLDRAKEINTNKITPKICMYSEGRVDGYNSFYENFIANIKVLNEIENKELHTLKTNQERTVSTLEI